MVPEIRRVHAENLGLWRQENLAADETRRNHRPSLSGRAADAREGLEGVVRGGKRVRTTLPGGEAERALDLVDRKFAAAAPNRLWVADFTYVSAWEKTVYVAFVIDVFCRRIVGWRVAHSMKTEFVLDTIEMALWSRDHEELPVGAGLIHHSDAGSQYTCFSFTRRLIDAGVDPSVGSVGDAYDNALAESTIGLFKTEMIEKTGRCGPSQTSRWRPSPGSNGSITAGSMEPAVTSHP